MKKTILILTLCSSINLFGAATLTPIASFPHTNRLDGDYRFVVAIPAVTNFNISASELSIWMATNPDFTITFTSNAKFTNPLGLAYTNGFNTQTNSPDAIFTNTVAWWTTNSSFSSGLPFNAGPVFDARLMISNSAATAITNTLPFTAYSLSLATNVTKAVIAAGSMLDLRYSYYNGIYYVEDYGKNSTNLTATAALSGSGAVYYTNGVFTVR